ncbi:hypothetical protein [Williamsia deligens]|uniref:DUF222 domain-containing protein n=1 Tax=Williamsia deligens TaxID=321325 RepID=A0ABW3G550_9NOCA|nr:hypothetical protein [Williamsia deligens]MCP2193931.1 hypothetical protein [Williamsia deligens]
MTTLSDTELLGILYRATGLISPVLDALADSDPFDGSPGETGEKGRGASSSASDDPVEVGDADSDADDLSFADKAVNAAASSLSWATNAASAPGSEKWQAMSVAERDDWWVTRVGSITNVLVAYPGVLGAVADRLPIQDVLGFTQQTFVLCAIARVHGVDDRRAQARMIAEVLCGRTIDDAVAHADAATLEKSVPDDVPDTTGQQGRPWSAREVVRRVWTTAKVLRAVVSEIRHRPSPSKLWRTLSKVPVVGAAADYVGERSALRHAADAAAEWLDAAAV